jgi:aryl sulfotransferase
VPPTRLRTLFYDSARWDDFVFRDDDIIIATPAKCGTTWTQRIVSLLVFDSVDLPQPLAHVSPWLDMRTRPLEDVVRELEAQTHRRFIKTHLPFYALPFDERVTYLTIGRDPRDVAISRRNHDDNMDMEKVVEEVTAVAGPDEEVPSGSPWEHDADWFREWVETTALDGPSNLGTLVRQLASYWHERHRPNVVLLHYGDLQRDLVGQMEYLAERLGVTRSRERLEELAPAASFTTMKEHAEAVAPNADQTFWRNTGDFFHTGTSGQWRDLITADDLARYEKRIHELCDPDLAYWLHNGGRTVESQ